MTKQYLDANTYLRDSYCLARSVLDSGWVPDDLIALWRGGAPVGVAVHEFLFYHGIHPRHRALKCFSYSGIGQPPGEVLLECADEIIASIQQHARVLIIDDVFDTGRTAATLFEKLKPLNIDLRIATVYWKPSANRTALVPNYYVKKTDDWLIFPHELDGLTRDEIKNKNGNIADLIRWDLVPPQS